jgi:hypothetical protein
MSERKNLRDRYARLSEYTNANLFISNNANPFLISPYTPINPGQYTKVTITQEIQDQLSSIISSFSSIINITDYSIRLSTIYPATATSTVRVDGSFVVDDDLTVGDAELKISEHSSKARLDAKAWKEYITYQNLLEVFDDESQREYYGIQEVPRAVVMATVKAMKDELGSYSEVADDTDAIAQRVLEVHPELTLEK